MLNMSRIVEEERVSDEVVVSLNSRKLSKISQSQSNNLSALQSKETSFAKKDKTRDEREAKPNNVSSAIEEADHRDEVKSIESAREASTKIEDMQEHSLFEAPTGPQKLAFSPEHNSNLLKSPLKHTKTLSLTGSGSLKTGPKTTLQLLQKPAIPAKNSKLSNLEVKKLISSLNFGSSASWNVIFDKKKDQSHLANAATQSLNVVPSLDIQKAGSGPPKAKPSRNASPSGAHSGKNAGAQQSFKNPKTKTEPCHRRTHSDTYNFSHLGGLGGCPLINSARLQQGKHVASQFSKQNTQEADALEVNLEVQISPIANSPAHPAPREDSYLLLEKELADLRLQNSHLKQENLNYRKVAAAHQMVEQHTKLADKFASLVSFLGKNRHLGSKEVLDFLHKEDSPPKESSQSRSKIQAAAAKPGAGAGLNKLMTSSQVKKGMQEARQCPLTKKTEQHSSAKDVRDKKKGLSDKSGTHASMKDVRGVKR